MKQRNGLCIRSFLGSLNVASCRQGLESQAGNQEAGIAGAGLQLELATKLKTVGGRGGGGRAGAFGICFVAQNTDTLRICLLALIAPKDYCMCPEATSPEPCHV